MKRTMITLSLAAAAPLALSACMGDGYGYGYGYGVGSVGYGWQSYPYDVWYDGYYGQFYDGYWGTDNYFYYRLFQNDNVWRRGDANHFHRNAPRSGGQFHSYSGQTHQPPSGARLPHYPSGQAGTQGRGGNGGHKRDRNGDHR